jgi:subtilisin family serine protease
MPSASKTGGLASIPLGSSVVPDEYIVVYRNDVNARAVTAHLAHAHGLSPRYRWDAPWLKGFSAKMTRKQHEKIRRHPHVQHIEPVVIGRGAGTQLYPYNWGLDRIDQRSLPLNREYVYTDSAPNVNVYIIDTGIRYTHSDFEGRAVPATDIITPGGTAADCHGHGTFVSALVGGWEYGVAKKVRLHSVRASNCFNEIRSDDAITAVRWVTNNHLDPAIANLSWSFTQVVPALDQEIYASIQAGVTYVVNAGNFADNACNYTPAHTLGTITVGATDSTDTRWSLSNYGACLNLFAPGAEIESAWWTGDYDWNVDSGTSYSTAHVTGIAALYVGRNPSATPATVKNAIVNNATPNVVINPGPNSPNRLAYSRF